jgi:hypothetical protein
VTTVRTELSPTIFQAFDACPKFRNLLVADI